jgi:maleylacetoacetate isomerase
MPRPLLYSFWRSSCSWRVRWALAIKGVEHDLETVDILHGGQDAPAFRAKNPMGYVPALVMPDGRCLSESIAILEHLEHLAPEPALYPKDPWLRARCRQLVALIATGIQPLQNTNVLGRVDPERGAAAKAWAAHFNEKGLIAYEALLGIIQGELGSTGPYSVGDALTAADVFLVPQVSHARRWGVDVSRFPRILAAEAAAITEPHAAAARPENQPDAPKK